MRRVTFRGLDKSVSKVVAEPRSLGNVKTGRMENLPVVRYPDISSSSDPLWRARSRVAKDLSVYMAASTLKIDRFTTFNWAMSIAINRRALAVN